MKYILLTLLFSTPLFADQVAILGEARDQKYIELKKKLITYCEESHPELLKQKDSLFMCYLQLEADTKYSDEIKRPFAVAIRNESRYLEKMVVDLQGNASQLSGTYIGKEVERIEDPCKFNPDHAICFPKAYGQLAVMPLNWSSASDPSPSTPPEKLCEKPGRLPAGKK